MSLSRDEMVDNLVAMTGLDISAALSLLEVRIYMIRNDIHAG
jgi:hypothetical protein